MLQFYLSLILDAESANKFEHLYHTYRQTMFWVANQLLNDHALAEDAVQDAFLRIIDHIENISLENCNKTKAFVVIIVRNISLDYLRRQKKLDETNLDDFEDYLSDPLSDPEQIWLANESSQRILEALKSVRQSYVDIMALRVNYEMDDKTIAQVLNITKENVRIQLHRCRAQLTKILKEDE